MQKTSIVRLTEAERTQLQDLISKGKAAAQKITHAHMLLKADAEGPAWTDDEIAQVFSVHANTVRGIRQRFVCDGVDAALPRKQRATPPRARLLDGATEARLIALRWSDPPAGQARWTLRLLADPMVALELVEHLSHETVRQTLKQTN